MATSLKRLLYVILVLFAHVQLCRAWDNVGHETIVELAKRHLTPEAKAGIARYMPYDITRDARWMDRHRSDSALLYMYHFHEQCINLQTLEYDPNAQVEKGDIMRGLCLADYNLSHREHLSDSVVVLNIRMLLHFIGDLHCPLEAMGESSRYGFGCFISGASKTADIEQSLVYGAQAAKELTVIITT